MIITRFIEKILPGASYPQKSKVPEGVQALRETVQVAETNMYTNIICKQLKTPGYWMQENNLKSCP